MEFRVVEKSYFTFETDLPPSSRNIHPSGILHAFRSTPTSKSNINGREEHTFAWINNSFHIEVAIQHLEKSGFERTHGIVFIPYSTKRNWLDRYPHAVPALETTMETGDVLIYLNWRPYLNGLSDMGKIDDDDDVSDSEKDSTVNEEIAALGTPDETAISDNSNSGDDDDVIDFALRFERLKRDEVHSNKRSHKAHTVRDNTLLPNIEREELHLEIYRYLFWLHGKMAAIERKDQEAEADTQAAAQAEALKSEEGASSSEESDVNAAAPALPPVAKSSHARRNGVNLTELQNVVKIMESTFAIIPNVIMEEEEGETGDEEKGAPFLDGALSDELKHIVAARIVAGKPKRRTRKRKMQIKGDDKDPNSGGRGFPSEFDDMFHRLVKYKEEHGDCLIHGKKSPLGHWVRNIRSVRTRLRSRGIEAEEVPPGKKLRNKTLTVERIERLNSIGFVWAIVGPKVPVEERFQELVEYYEMNGHWPSQSMQGLGTWIHRQRQRYSKKEPEFMKTLAPRLDEIGFEWTPKGNTRMSWEEGFGMLMEFNRINGHFEVPSGAGLDKMSDERRLYKWVASVHDMYRSYKLGRQSGSLSDERVVLLVEHGFVFRDF